MRWSDERYVRVYTRDTGEWLALGWEAQALFLFALRKADRAGIIHTGRSGMRGMAGMTGMPLEVVSRALPLLLEDGCVRECPEGYVIPNFIAAQEAHISDAQRKRDQRERDRDKALAGGFKGSKSGADIMSGMSRQDVTQDCHAGESRVESRQDVTLEVTGGHTESQTVTPSRSVPSRAKPDLFGVAEAPPVSSAKKPGWRAKKPEPTDPRHAPLVRELCEGVGYPFRDGRDGRAVTDLLRLADQRESTRGENAPAEVLRRARIGWTWKGFPSCRSLTELRDHWGHYERPQEASGTRGPAPPSDFENPRAGSPIPEHLRSRPEDVEAF